MLHLKTIRQSKELSVPALSRKSGVPIRTIEDLERRGDGRISTLYKLATALDISLDALYKDEQEDQCTLQRETGD